MCWPLLSRLIHQRSLCAGAGSVRARTRAMYCGCPALGHSVSLGLTVHAGNLPIAGRLLTRVHHMPGQSLQPRACSICRHAAFYTNDHASAQDLMPLSARVPHRPAPEETINDPTNPKHYWRFRMHVNLEQLAADPTFLSGLREMMAGATPQWAGGHLVTMLALTLQAELPARLCIAMSALRCQLKALFAESGRLDEADPTAPAKLVLPNGHGSKLSGDRPQ